VFGVFWGTWGASVPSVRSQAGSSDGQLGMALLFIGAGALPAMLLTGRVIDRLGVRFTAAVALMGPGVSGLIVAYGAADFTSLCVGLLLVGAASGAADVAINAAAGAAEQTMTRPVITRSHGVFSAFPRPTPWSRSGCVSPLVPAEGSGGLVGWLWAKGQPAGCSRDAWSWPGSSISTT
jgi:MFS family permease